MAEELYLDWHTVKELDTQYAGEQRRRAGCPAPRVIGIDEIAIAKGHLCRIVVSNLEAVAPFSSAARTARRLAWTSSSPGWSRKMRQNPLSVHGHVAIFVPSDCYSMG